MHWWGGVSALWSSQTFLPTRKEFCNCTVYTVYCCSSVNMNAIITSNWMPLLYDLLAKTCLFLTLISQIYLHKIFLHSWIVYELNLLYLLYRVIWQQRRFIQPFGGFFEMVFYQIKPILLDMPGPILRLMIFVRKLLSICR